MLQNLRIHHFHIMHLVWDDLACEQSLFSQLSLSSAGLERANWSLARAFLARVTIPRDCSQSRDDCNTVPAGEIENNGYATGRKSLVGGRGCGVNKVHYGLCDNGEFFTLGFH